MKIPCVLIALTALLLALGIPALSQDAAKDTPAKSPSLCQPGFIFIELVTERVADYLAFFESVAPDFKVVRNDGGYVVMKSQRGELVFMESKGLPNGHPNKATPTGSGRGLGVEIAVVVADLDKAFTKAVGFKSKGWRISAGIGRRPWGARDFRIVSPDGYYLRFTESM